MNLSLDLTRPVILKGVPRHFGEYASTLEREQDGALSWLRDAAAPWTVPAGLRAKVADDGTFLPFFGDTTVFELTTHEIDALARAQAHLHEACPDALAHRLDPATFHVTLHDLANGPDERALRDTLQFNEAQCGLIFTDLHRYLAARPEEACVDLVSTRVYPSVSISMVMGFTPRTDADFRRLMNAYNLFDNVVYLDYWLRPHVTLAYFRPRLFSGREKRALFEARDHIDRSAAGSVQLRLDLRTLAYQVFRDMDHYETRRVVSDS